MDAVKIGQVWQDNDKRRGDRRIEIIKINGASHAVGLVVGTEKETALSIERLTARWTLVKDVPVEPETTELKAKHKTREQWLEAAVKELTKKVFEPKDYTPPTVRVSVGWPGGRGKKTGIRGQCFVSHSASDKVNQIFVSPTEADPLTVVAVVAHELIHAIDDNKDGHKKNFIKIAKDVGFLPQWTSSDNRSDALDEKLSAIVEKLGAYPHAAIRPTERPNVQKTYMLKVLCPVDTDYFVRMTQGKIEEYGTPICPICREEMEVEEK